MCNKCKEKRQAHKNFLFDTMNILKESDEKTFPRIEMLMATEAGIIVHCSTKMLERVHDHICDILKKEYAKHEEEEDDDDDDEDEDEDEDEDDDDDNEYEDEV